MANFNLKELEKSILKIDYDTDSARQFVNNQLLDIIRYYDEVDQDTEFLDLAKKHMNTLQSLKEKKAKLTS